MDIFGQFTGLALAALAALLCGAVLMRFRQPPIAGYVLAGLLLGPSAIGAFGEQMRAGLLAELGVTLLLFVIGAQLSLRAFLATWKTAIFAVALQTSISLAAVLTCSGLFGLSLAVSVMIGFALALSSGAAAISMLHQIGALRGRVGRMITGILVAQSFAFLPMLFFVDYLGSNGTGAELIGKIVIAVALLTMLVQFLGQQKPIDLPVIKRIGVERDLAPITALAYCLATASVFGFLGLSAPFGAFMAGLIIGRSNQRRRMMAPFRAVRNILMLTFFLSIGLLTDLDLIAGNLGGVIVLALLISLLKTATNVATLRVLGQNWRNASVVGLSMSQLGEFSIILAAAALAAGAIGQQELKFVIAVTGLGLIISPFWLIAARRIHVIANSADPTLGEISATAFRSDFTSLLRNLKFIRHGEFRAVFDNMRISGRHPSAPLPANDDENPPTTPEQADPNPEIIKQDTAETIAAIRAGVRAARFGAPAEIRTDRTENSNS